MSSRRAAFAALALASCFGPGPADDAYVCGAPPHECPPGYYCATTHRCRRAPEASCSDGALDGDESDVDCGGRCLPCDVGRACRADGDCATATCADAICELATAPPFWRPLPLLARPRVRPTVVATPDGRVFAIGGGDDANPISNSVEVYDLAAGAWQPFAPTVFARSGGAGALVDDKLYVAGGRGNERQVEAYDFAAAMWRVVQNDIGFGIDDAGFAAGDGALYVFGGLDPPGAATGNVYRFLPASGWMALARLSPRHALAGARGPDGLVYAIGGNDGAAAIADVQRYSPVSARWAAAAPLPTATAGLTAATGADGRIYAVGGMAGGTPVASVWAYTPAADRWTAVAPLQAPRASLGAATGSDGALYAIGGTSGAAALRDVEAYGPVATAAPTGDGGLTLSGGNFAASAVVSIYAGAGASGAPVATATSDGDGALAPVTLPPPAGAGSFVYTLVDDRSRYPVIVRSAP